MADEFTLEEDQVYTIKVGVRRQDGKLYISHELNPSPFPTAAYRAGIAYLMATMTKESPFGVASELVSLNALARIFAEQNRAAPEEQPR